jgi:hypothetical protein
LRGARKREAEAIEFTVYTRTGSTRSAPSACFRSFTPTAEPSSGSPSASAAQGQICASATASDPAAVARLVDGAGAARLVLELAMTRPHAPSEPLRD